MIGSVAADGGGFVDLSTGGFGLIGSHHRGHGGPMMKVKVVPGQTFAAASRSDESRALLIFLFPQFCRKPHRQALFFRFSSSAGPFLFSL